ncbi:MAG: LPS export ABC transporter ATP-binding protein [Gammaproteobacteria bacterium]|uniref:LPS export ABC transporter ATP-binding protein n=1 Tax=Limnobacter sp. TaxID=2003368 RepID=UPI001D29CAA3|nr:LPS export ABC transporter ATP-binding protein [Limnobacter sp.]MBU0783617.1 LPS export ABC transporter ATP-binding protein [Gammaproteobacteria bacterium]MBU0850350.1 LPS export ABC transporter ATP-binding protein [Gammaproteobacteria bacterium]MBU1267459.1 LPS export ABC transporter ATP-binding protein [Gammaproteobacteria bacterium]MBU1529087.1 LPS export ABC transporter ATP-binding protein [Gammaproteobacteria bacterium]MBU1781687.1 LPS export ABC transporter ATP-binding protein [Gammap
MNNTPPAQTLTGQGRLQALSLRKAYRSKRVIEDVSLHVDTGEVVGLLGPNGAGKTTCFYMIVGLVSADEGNICLEGRDITLQPIHERARAGLSYLPQEASVFRKLTVEDNIRAVLEINPPKDKSIDQAVEDLLNDLQITHIRTSLAASLSGGERRRLEIARALGSQPRFILLDEPFAGVDPIAVLEIQRIVAFLKSKGIGVLITDHNVRETLGICDRAYIISAGHVLASGSPEQIVKNDDVRRVYLGEHFRM